MGVSLEAFLVAHPLDTGLRLVRWEASGEDTLLCELDANPWWLTAPERSGADHRLSIHMRRVRSSNVRFVGWSPEVRDLAVVADDPHVWSHGTHATIYGNSRLADPARFFLELWDLARFELGAEDAVCAMFEDQPYAEWVQRVTQYQTYQLLTGPLPLLEASKPLLDAQAVEYRLFPGPTLPTHDLRCVWIGDSWVVCAEALVDHWALDRHTP